MNICIIGDSLTSLALAKNLVNKKIKVSIYYTNKKNFKSRTLGISKDNLDFIYKEIIKVKKNLFWGIKKIDIFNETQKILEFKNAKKELFFMVRYNNFYNILNSSLKKNKFFKKILIKDNNFYKKILEKKKYDLFINCETGNEIYKSFFYKNFKKDYDSYAYSLIINHIKTENKKALQIFSKLGPIAFLPISKNQTSIVFSKKNKNIFLNQNKLQELIEKYNPGYKINFFGKFEKFKLNLSIIRNYYYKKVMILGDGLHKVHPLAGQGFNMTLRDIKTLSKIINNRIDSGLELNYSIYEEFEKNTKHFNFVFSSGIDFIHEFFKFNNKYSIKLLKIAGKNKIFNKIFTKYADKGLVF